jgi:hypothetical protein
VVYRRHSVGTNLVFDIHPTGSADPFRLTHVGTRLFFSADDGVHGTELWSYSPAT